MALRYATLKEQRKLAEEDGNVAGVAKIDQRIDEIAAIAAQLGYPPVNDKKGRRDQYWLLQAQYHRSSASGVRS